MTDQRPRLLRIGRGLVTLVDAEDYERFRHMRWYLVGGGARRTGYAATPMVVDGKKTLVYLHRLILQPRHGELTDHINRDTLDNRRANLRVATAAENRRNQVARLRKVPLTARIGPSLIAAARAEAELQGLNLSAEIRRALRFGLEEEARRRALAGARA